MKRFDVLPYSEIHIDKILKDVQVLLSPNGQLAQEHNPASMDWSMMAMDPSLASNDLVGPFFSFSLDSIPPTLAQNTSIPIEKGSSLIISRLLTSI